MATTTAGTSTVGCTYLTQPVSSKCLDRAKLTSPFTSSFDALSFVPTLDTGTAERNLTVATLQVRSTPTNYSTSMSNSTSMTTQTKVMSTVTSQEKPSSTILTRSSGGVSNSSKTFSGASSLLFSSTTLPSSVPNTTQSSTNGSSTLDHTVTREKSASPTSESCIPHTASSCAVSCAITSGQSAASCATKCETDTGCSVTKIASTTTKSRDCSPSNWASLDNGPGYAEGGDGGEEGPDPIYTGSVPPWVAALPSHTRNESSKAANGARTTSTGSGVNPTWTNEPPKTDGNGNVYNSTDILAGTIWGCRSTSTRNDLGPYPITMCLSSSSIGMAFTPTPDPTPDAPQTTQPPPPEATGEDCGPCYTDMGASSCADHDDQCLLNECEANQNCKDCEFSCSTLLGTLFRRHYGLLTRTILSAGPRQMSKKLSRRNAIEPTPLARDSEHDRIRSVQKRVEHGPVWKKFAPKGFKYFKMLQDKPVEDSLDPPMCELDAYFEVTKKGPISKPPLDSRLFGVEPTVSYYQFNAQNKKGNPFGLFQNTVSAQQGIFFATFNDRGEVINDKGEVIQKPLHYQMSTIAWWMWKHTVMLSEPQGKTQEQGYDFSNFKYFARVNIVNEDTIEIVREAVGDNKEPLEFKPEDESEDNAFWPLLGSPNGNGIAWFLADHKKSLKGKTISKITVWNKDNFDEVHMWATIV